MRLLHRFFEKKQKNTLATVALTSIADLTGQKTQASLLLSLSNQHSFSRKRKNKKNNLNGMGLSIDFFLKYNCQKAYMVFVLASK